MSYPYSQRDEAQRRTFMSLVTSVTGTVGTSIISLRSLFSVAPGQQTSLLVTNNSSNSVVYIGFLDSMTTTAGWHWKLSPGNSAVLRVNEDVIPYGIASASATVTLTALN